MIDTRPSFSLMTEMALVAATDAIIPVEIGGLVGAYVQGIFVVYPGETSATWNADAPVLRLRWWDDGTWFEITK